EDVGLREHLLREAVLGVVQEGDAGGDGVPVVGDAGGDGVPVVGDDAVADRRVHAVGVELAHAPVALFVAVLAPDGHAQGRGGRGGGHGGVLSSGCGSGGGRSGGGPAPGHLTAPPVAPAATYFWAMIIRITAGREQSTAVDITALQSVSL